MLAPLATGAQQGKLFRLGYLNPAASSDPVVWAILPMALTLGWWPFTQFLP